MKINNNIQESYCSFEVSKLLKEKGFDSLHERWYFLIRENTKGVDGKLKIGELKTNIGCSVDALHFADDNYAIRPTHALAIEWIRVNFRIHITYIFGFKEGTTEIEYFPAVDDIKALDFMENSAPCNTPQEATEAALLYTLKNLI